MDVASSVHGSLRSISRGGALALAALAALVVMSGCQGGIGVAAGKKTPAEDAAVRGKYLVDAGSCNDCHTPWTIGPQGPMPDPTRLLSGHPEGALVPPTPVPPGWGMLVSPDNTAFAGPWGTSFSANLTPDASGIGNLTAEQFAQALRTGKHFGSGRTILPPMPWYSLAKLTDQDIAAIWAYLQSIPPIPNVVPDPLPPGGALGDSSAMIGAPGATTP